MVETGRWKITDRGNVLSLRRGRWRKIGWLGGTGETYLKVGQTFGDSHVSAYVHNLVYYHFNKRRDAFKQIDHIDGDPLNNRPENLEEVTQSENIRRARLGKEPVVRDERFTDEDVKYIRTCGIPTARLAREWGVNKSRLMNIRRKRTYKKVAA
jgi:hypothetical protein